MFKKIQLSILACFLLLAANAQNKLISYEKVESLSKDDLNAFWKANGVPKLITPLKNAVDIYELYYHTNLPDGTQVVATGLYYVPVGSKYEIPTMQYNHGTTIKPRGENDYDYNGESTICKIFAADGYAVAWQDYIGLGKGEGFHPYQHLETEGQSGVDLLRAIREINQEIGLVVNDQLFITGYSQGGHATLAVHKTIQEKYPNEFTVTASSPMSGAHDMSGVQNIIMDKDYTQPHYLPYLLYGYEQIYDLFETDSAFVEVFKPEYQHVISKILSKGFNVQEINDMLPSQPFTMISDSIYDLYLNDPTFPFTVALKQNNTYDWVPEAPVQFCYCVGDEEVYYKNSQVAIDYMKSHGAEKIIDRKVSNGMTHRTCADYAVMYSKFFFDSFKRGHIKGRKGNIFKNLLVKIVVAMEE